MSIKPINLLMLFLVMARKLDKLMPGPRRPDSFSELRETLMPINPFLDDSWLMSRILFNYSMFDNNKECSRANWNCDSAFRTYLYKYFNKYYKTVIYCSRWLYELVNLYNSIVLQGTALLMSEWFNLSYIDYLMLLRI